MIFVDVLLFVVGLVLGRALASWQRTPKSRPARMLDVAAMQTTRPHNNVRNENRK